MDDDVASMIREAARRAALRRVGESENALRSRWHQDVTAAVWKRAAAMVSRCLASTAQRDLHEQLDRDVAAVADDVNHPVEELVFRSVVLGGDP